jgi:hypothetical protein
MTFLGFTELQEYQMKNPSAFVSKHINLKENKLDRLLPFTVADYCSWFAWLCLSSPLGHGRGSSGERAARTVPREGGAAVPA